MNEKIIFTTESTVDISPELIERYNIKIIPLGVSLDGQLYTDGVDINPDKIYEHYAKTGHLPKTTASNIDSYVNFFKQFVDDGYTVIHIALGSDMSSTYQNAVIAAQEFDNVYTVDTMSLSTGIALVLLNAAEMAKKGFSAEEIVKTSEELVPCVDASFVIDSLEFLYKGGRCSALSALGANLLKLKPSIQVKNGKLGVAKKYRGKFSDTLMSYVSDKLENIDNIRPERIFVTHAGCDDEIVKAVIDKVKSYGYFDEILLTRAGCTISSHCGQNCLGILFVHKTPIE